MISEALEHSNLLEEQVSTDSLITFGTANSPNQYATIDLDGQFHSNDEHGATRGANNRRVGTHILHKVVNGSLETQTCRYAHGVSAIPEQTKFIGLPDEPIGIEITSIQCGPESSCIICGFLEDKRQELENMVSLLKQWWPVRDLFVEHEPEYRRIYLAKFDDFCRLYRVQLVEKKIRNFKVLYIDYGTVGTVDSLYFIPQDSAVNHYHVARTPPFGIPFFVAGKPTGLHKFSEKSTNSMFICEGQLANCSLAGIVVDEYAFAATVTIDTAKGPLNLKDILVKESSCCCIL